MSKYDFILAKSEQNGGTSLRSHLESVSFFARAAARYAGMDEEIARIGGLLHDIGKASPEFQRRLKMKPSPDAIPFRHEIASLFFLKLTDKSIWPQLIDMIVAHHKSIKNIDFDGQFRGLLDLVDYYDIFDFYVEDFERWSKEACGILEELGMTTFALSTNDAQEAYQYSIDYCLDKGENWSEWKGLLMGADHFASAIGDSQEHIPTLFATPNVEFYNRQHELYPLSLISSDKGKRHTFIKAPTGAGKTDFLIKRCQRRIFYILPFQASINAMFERIRHDLEGKVEDVRLQHSMSRLKFYDNEDGDGKMQEMIQDKFGASVKVLTPHQIASIAFGVKGYETTLFDLKGCDVILDEIHTYSGIIQSIVLKMVEILNHEGCRIHIGTATMPSVLENELLNILGKEQTQYVQLPNDILDSFDRHIIYKVGAFEETLPTITEAIRNGQKIFLVCNRIGNAQSIYKQMEELFPEIDKILLHSRFKRKDRNAYETALKEDYNHRRTACVVVATQVVEVSLDISFDLMVTEAAPIDAMIQRFGRINRVRNATTIGHYKPVYVVAPPEKKSDARPYSQEVIQRSFDVLPHEGLLKESSLQTLIDSVYTEIKQMKWEGMTIFTEKEQWQLTELCDKSKSVLLDELDVSSAVCITEEDEEIYRRMNNIERCLLEIPVSSNSICPKNLRLCKDGNYPYVVPNVAYSDEMGLDYASAIPDNYDMKYQFL